MAKQTIFLGTVPGDKTGTKLRAGGDMINDNFTEIYATPGDTLKIKIFDNGATAVTTEAHVITATGLTAIQAGDGYIAAIKYDSLGQHYLVIIISYVGHWFIFRNDNSIII